MSTAAGLSGKTVLITGAAGGIGRATARVMAERGARLLLTDLAAEPLDRCASELSGTSVEVHARVADITDSHHVASLFEWALSTASGVDHLVNNAGIVTQGRLESFPDHDWNRVLDVNLTAAYRCTKAFAQQHIQLGRGGSIVNVASMSYRGMTQQVAYAVSKGGVVTLTKSTAMELARYGIRANAVAPGMTETVMVAAPDTKDSLRDRMIPQIPLRRYAQPREIATVIAFLLSDDASYVTGEVVHASGGARL